MSTRIHGMVPPLVTPLDEQGGLDRAGLNRLVDRVIGGGVHGVFVLGTTGEAPSLNGQLKRALLQETCVAVGGRVPVLAGVTCPNLDETIALTLVAADAGVTAVVVTAPFYFTISQDELYAWCRRVVEVSPLPVMLYNMPGNTKVTFEPGTLRRFTQEPRVIGIKDSSGDFACLKGYLDVVRRDRPDWSVMTGPEAFTVDAMELGGAGCVGAGAMIWPEAWVQVYDLASKEMWDQARGKQALLSARLQEIYAAVTGDGRVPKAAKAALAALKVCQDHPAPPLAHCGLEAREKIAALVLRDFAEANTLS